VKTLFYVLLITTGGGNYVAVTLQTPRTEAECHNIGRAWTANFYWRTYYCVPIPEKEQP
jgi:hypothetical protein